MGPTDKQIVNTLIIYLKRSSNRKLKWQEKACASQASESSYFNLKSSVFEVPVLNIEGVEEVGTVLYLVS